MNENSGRSIKSQFLRKVSCLNHEDRTPSLAVYADGSGYCFSCNTRFNDVFDKVPIVVKPVEDIKSSIERIESLPTQEIRGLNLHFDNTGYYVVWPNKQYYKCRQWLATPKYKNPQGITQPWFNILQPGNRQAIIIEGEINALSVASLGLPIDIYCPGSAGQFKLNKADIALTKLADYDTLILIADKDTAGISAILKLKKEIIEYNPGVVLRLMSPDYNDILQQYGKEGLKQRMGM